MDNLPNNYRRWIYNLTFRVKNGKHLPWEMERMWKEAQEIEFKEHPATYREWMGKELPFRP